jgi:hypothetical protein
MPHPSPGRVDVCLMLVARVLLGVAGVLLGVAAVAWCSGGLHLHLGRFDVSVTNPWRTATQALAALLVREVLPRPGKVPPRVQFVALLTALVAGLAVQATPCLVGDGPEYVAMAYNLAQGRLPSLTSEELKEVARQLPSGLQRYELKLTELRAADGRQEFYHSWAYPLAAAPFVRVAQWLGQPLLSAFTVLNSTILLVAALIVFPRFGPRVTLLILGGPILWWVDKAHGEIFTVCLLLAALALLPERPGLSLTLQGMVGLQNPTLGVGLVASGLWLWHRKRLSEPGTRLGLAVGLGLLLAGPSYSFWRVGHASPLSRTVLPHWPSGAEFGAVLFDSNLGLAFAWPTLVLATGLAVLATARSRTLRLHLDSAILLSAAGMVVLFAVTQPANLNHGGTRGVSRYALWLVPLAAPLLALFDRSSRWARFTLSGLAAGSLALALGDYQPQQAQRYVQPTPAAAWLWRRFPALTNPLPEVFAERTAGFEGPGVLPSATPGCEKALLVVDQTATGWWPLWCRPAEVPKACAAIGSYCYANRTAGGLAFAPAPAQPAFAGQKPVAWAWGGAPSDAAVRLLAGLPWDSLRLADPRNTELLFVGRRGLGQVRGRINPEILLVWIERPREDASVTLKPGPGRRAILIDPERGRVLRDSTLDPTVPTRMPIPWLSPLLLVVVPTAFVPPDLRVQALD